MKNNYCNCYNDDKKVIYSTDYDDIINNLIKTRNDIDTLINTLKARQKKDEMINNILLNEYEDDEEEEIWTKNTTQIPRYKTRRYNYPYWSIYPIHHWF